MTRSPVTDDVGWALPTKTRTHWVGNAHPTRWPKVHDMHTVGWGIIGCGDVTEIKSGPAFQQAEGSELVAVMRRTASRAEDYARRHGVPRWYDDTEKLIHDPAVDAIYIATPPGSHCEYALRAAAAGKPAYVEKPMARNHAECQQMVAAFAANNVPLFVAYYRRALPRFLKAKELIGSGRLGTVTGCVYQYEEQQREVDASDLPWRLLAEQSGGGLFFDLGSHALDILDFFLGPLEGVAGTAANRASAYNVEDVVSMSFRTVAGVPGVASWNFASSTDEDRIEITGTRGRVSLPVFGNEPVRFDGSDGTESFDLPNPKHIQQPLVQTIVDELLGRGSCPSTGETAARTSAVMDRAVESYYGSRESGFWESPGSWPVNGGRET